MAQVKTDPEAIVKIARELKQMNDAIDASVKRVQSALRASNWDDPVRRDFERNLESISRTVKNIQDVSNDCQKNLNRKAQQLRDFLAR